MPNRDVRRDIEGRDFQQYVADQVMSAINTSGKSVLEVARESGVNRETLRERLHNVRSFNVAELALIAQALGIAVAELIRADEFRPID